jgi:hypothetical protein
MPSSRPTTRIDSVVMQRPVRLRSALRARPRRGVRSIVVSSVRSAASRRVSARGDLACCSTLPPQ